MELILENISKTYNGSVKALRDISLNVPGGLFVSLIGSSGAGKTTLLRVINGSVIPDSGRVLAGGADLLALKGKEQRDLRRKMGMIYQDFRLVESVSCLQNVLDGSLAEMAAFPAFFGRFGEERTERARRLLERVGLGDRLAEKVKNLSGGQKQRVAIARALMQRPELLLADEPVASLDPVTGRQILELIRGIQKTDGITVIMNSHNPVMAMEFSDRVIGLSGGEIVFDGDSGTLTSGVIRGIYGADSK